MSLEPATVDSAAGKLKEKIEQLKLDRSFDLAVTDARKAEDAGKPQDAIAAYNRAIKASASSVRPCDSSQRGDSGRFLRRYQTISEPTAAMMNIGRQPNAGMMR